MWSLVIINTLYTILVVLRWHLRHSHYAQIVGLAMRLLVSSYMVLLAITCDFKKPR